ncbi:MAG: alanine racemase, partial [Acidobacteriaceae bacterium]|nr:alanine racemase [Acidobacteriaceae bacterium]
MDFCLSGYTLRDASSIITPALLIYPDVVDANIQATLRMIDNDANRWRPHIKTAKLAAVVRRFVEHGIVNFKCATTLELQTACEAGARDVLVAFAMAGANARRILELAHEFPAVRISVLVESQRQADAWRDSGIGIFIDVNPGMNRTGISQESAGDVVSLARTIGRAFRGLHYYDGHISSPSLEERQRAAHAGYDQLMRVVQSLKTAGLACEEVITSGTPAAPFGYSYEAFTRGGFIHR